MFVGAFVGDFVRTAIGTKISTGTVIGTGAMLIHHHRCGAAIRVVDPFGEADLGFDKFVSSLQNVMALERLHRNCSATGGAFTNLDSHKIPCLAAGD